jgi:hypothetical protein
MEDIKMSVAYGWKKFLETWWWITLAGLYMPVGGVLYLLAGITAARFTSNPDILEKLNYRTFILLTKTPPGIKWFVGYAITTLVMFAIIYFFAGFVPSKSAANKNHNRLMAKTAAIFSALNIVFALLSYFVIASSSTQPSPFSFNTMLSQYLSGIAKNVFGFIFFTIIAIISYIYEKFTLKNVFQATVIYFVMETLQIIISDSFMPITRRVTNAVPSPYNILIAYVAAFVIIVFTIFIMAETVLQDSLNKGTKRGLHLLHMRSNLVWTYIAVYIVVYVVIYAFDYVMFLSYRVTHITPSSFSFYAVPTVWAFVSALGEAFLVFVTFQLARMFENRENQTENYET